MFICVYFAVHDQIDVDTLWGRAASGGWRPSSAPRSDWPSKFGLHMFHIYTCFVGSRGFILKKWIYWLLFCVYMPIQLLQPKPMATYEFVVMVDSISKEVRYGTKSCLYIVITAYSPCLRDSLPLKQVYTFILIFFFAHLFI